MLGLIIVFFIARGFYRLAQKHERNQWLFGILGVVIFYISQIAAGFIIGFIAAATNNEQIFEGPNLVLGLIGLPIGFIATGVTYYLLKKAWEKNLKEENPNLLDDSSF